MIKSNKFKRIIIKFTALLMCFSLILLSACTGNDDTGIKTKKGVESRNTISSDNQDASVHYTKSAESFSETAASSGFIELKIDPASKSFCIHETTKDKIWSVLPLLSEVAQGEELLSNASTVAITVNGGTDIYHLNSQDNSLIFGKASYTLIENGAQFIYDIFPDSNTAQKTSYEKNDIGFRVTVTVTIKDGSMTVDCSHSNITGNTDAFIENLELLNGFGSFNDSQEDDFLLVPDGCGAIIKTAIYDESFEPLSFAVYGADPSTSIEASGNAIVPAFGIKHGDSAFVSLIQKGDAVAYINADKATNISEYNTVYSSFNITPVLYEDKTLYASKTVAANEISLCYRFLSGNNATYAGLASACREQLIRNSVLSTKSVKLSDYLPFYLTLTGAAKDTVGPFTYLKKLTTFEQAQDMLIRMKNKGINNVSVRYAGIYSGGLDSEDIEGASMLMRLGGSGKLTELYDYITAQKMSLFLDINLISSSNGFSGGNAVNIKKKTTEYNPQNYLSEYMKTDSESRNFRRISKLTDVIANVINSSKNLGFSGYCLNDAGSLLYSDFSYNGLLREEASNEISKAVAPLSTGHSVMVSTGNFYLLKNVDSVINIPLTSHASESGAYISVPFVQLILHGIVDYAGEAINTSTNHSELLLKYIEYGACPHYEWTYEPVGGNTDGDMFYYDNTVNTAAEFYTKANEALNDLRDARMTDHYEIDDGIFCTEYDTGSMVYVNYTDSDYTVLGAVVEARSFIRIN